MHLRLPYVYIELNVVKKQIIHCNEGEASARYPGKRAPVLQQ